MEHGDFKRHPARHFKQTGWERHNKKNLAKHHVTKTLVTQTSNPDHPNSVTQHSHYKKSQLDSVDSKFSHAWLTASTKNQPFFRTIIFSQKKQDLSHVSMSFINVVTCTLPRLGPLHLPQPPQKMASRAPCQNMMRKTSIKINKINEFCCPNKLYSEFGLNHMFDLLQSFFSYECIWICWLTTVNENGKEEFSAWQSEYKFQTR